MKKGVSFTVLAATVVIMVILLTTITIAGTNTIDDSKKLSFATEISSLQQSVTSYKDKNDGIYPVKDSIVLDISDLNEDSKNQFIQNGEQINDNKVILNEIDYDKISITSLKYGNLTDGDTDMYVVSQTTGKIYYAKGMKIGNKQYFTLTEEISNSLSTNNVKAQKASKNNNNLVIFSPSNINYTTENITVDVKVPLTCNIYAILVDGEVISSYQTSQIEGYNVYTVSRDGNYVLQVKYNLAGDTANVITATYNVNNVDNIAPVLNVDENIVPLSAIDTNTNLLGYLKITECQDTLSGIKNLKYESNSIFSGNITDDKKQNIKPHFENNGKKVEGEIIPIEKGSRSITVYAEDNAGNWTMQTINISL